MKNTIHNRIKAYNQLIESQLVNLDSDDRDKAKSFLLGYIMKYISSQKIKQISEELKKFIEEI